MIYYNHSSLTKVQKVSTLCRLHKSTCICCVTFVFSELFPYLVCVLFHLFLDFDLYIVVTSTHKSIIIIIIFSVFRHIVDD
jgi:hypothetical protein